MDNSAVHNGVWKQGWIIQPPPLPPEMETFSSRGYLTGSPSKTRLRPTQQKLMNKKRSSFLNALLTIWRTEKETDPNSHFAQYTLTRALTSPELN